MSLPEIIKAGVYNFTIQQGSRLFFSIKLSNKTTGAALDLTGLSHRAYIRESFDSDTKLAEMTVQADSDPTSGIVNFSLTNIQTRSITSTIRPDVRKIKLGYWDYELVDGVDPSSETAESVRALEGEVGLSREVTKVDV